MTDEPHNLILEHLRALRAGQERLEGDLMDVRRGLGNVESGLAGLRSEVALVHTAIAQDA